MTVGHFVTAERPEIVLFPRQKSVFSRFRGLDVRFCPHVYKEKSISYFILSLFCVPAEWAIYSIEQIKNIVNIDIFRDPMSRFYDFFVDMALSWVH